MQMHEETICNEALDIADERAREEFLAKACAGDEQLRRQVERLLEIYPQGDVFEPTCPGIPLSQNEASTTREKVGDTIGPYKLLEQAQLSGLDIDTRSDIFSLGVLLYELLTGTTPVTRGKLTDVTYDELRRLIQDEDLGDQWYQGIECTMLGDEARRLIGAHLGSVRDTQGSNPSTVERTTDE